MRSVVIFGIFLGKYIKFFESFISSCDKNFLSDLNKHYVIFTDASEDSILNSTAVKNLSTAAKVTVIPELKRGWPYDSMLRFRMFNDAITSLQLRADYCFFMNANSNFVSQVSDETLPIDVDIVCVHHPAFYTYDSSFVPYERRPQSNFCISDDDGKYYVQGCYFGGKFDPFMRMSLELSSLIDDDTSRGIIPVWHDESALNWYVSTKDILLMHPGYAYPESASNLPFDKKIVMIDKNRHGGYHFLRS